METMRANVFCGANEIRVREVPRPRAGVGEAVIKITLTTICGTDVHILRGEYPVKPGLIIRRLIETVRHGRVDLTPLLTHTFTLDNIVEAYDLFAARQDGVLKVGIRP